MTRSNNYGILVFDNEDWGKNRDLYLGRYFDLINFTIDFMSFGDTKKVCVSGYCDLFYPGTSQTYYIMRVSEKYPEPVIEFFPVDFEYTCHCASNCTNYNLEVTHEHCCCQE